MSKNLPDLMIQSSSDIDFVGMEGIEGILNLKQTIPVLANVYVNLSHRRGIHMSRLYRVLMDELFEKTLTWKSSLFLMKTLIQSQQSDLKSEYEKKSDFLNSEFVKLQIQGRWSKKQSSLLTGLKGLRQYPFRLQWQYSLKNQNDLKMQIRLKLLYSSTCPMSLALSEELWKQNQIATPHAQRSQAIVVLNFTWKDIVKIKQSLPEYIDHSIEKLEGVLRTPVQTSVKRQDEQEFARLNGQNPMFCEDAVRILNKELLNWSELKSFQIKVRHLESLHPFDAVASINNSRREIHQ